MLAKLAVRNVRRSARDYGIYFITLLFGVSVFYAFNSIASQRVLFDLKGIDFDFFTTIDSFMSVFSIAVAFALGFLVVYANRFLIKRRKHEFGIYLLLGMRPAQVSQIVLMETAAVGLTSLAVGIALGLGLSQLLSFVTAGMFQMEMNDYRFIFSADALWKTVACFALIFAVVAAFNTVEVSRSKLSTLLAARSANQKVIMRNPWVSLIGLIASIACLACAYRTLARTRLLDLNVLAPDFMLATALMLVGTFVFFWSVAGGVIALVQRTRGIYFKGLAMFSMRQIASKINTAFISLWAVCVLLFFGIAVFATGMGVAALFSEDIAERTLYDHTLVANADPFDVYESDATEEERAQTRALMEENGWDAASFFAQRSEQWSAVVEASAQVDYWAARETTYGQICDLIDYDYTDTALASSPSFPRMPVSVVSESQFNAARALAGRDPVRVGEDGFAIDNTVAATDELASQLAQSDCTLAIGDSALHPTGVKLSHELAVRGIASEYCILIVPDAVVESLKEAGGIPFQSVLDIDYAPGVSRAEGSEKMTDILTEALPISESERAANPERVYQPGYWPVTYDTSALQNTSQSIGARVLITYLAVYIGFVLLVATAAVLAIQQLSETSDSIGRYRTLAQIGCDKRMIMRSVRRQTLVYFAAPLIVAACHASCVIWILQHELYDAFGISSAGPIATTVGLLAVAYGGYLAITYLGCKGIVRGSLGKRLLN